MFPLPNYIRVAIVANDFTPKEPVEDLIPYVDIFVKNQSNLGYGRAINLLLSQLPYSPKYICVMNTDLSWKPGTFDTMLGYIDAHDDVVMLVPRVCDLNGDTQMLCKQNPTLFGLISRRFIPKYLKSKHIIRYDNWYVNSHLDYNRVIESSYLSGCCMLIKTSAFLQVGGFDERYFLYLEDADISRALSLIGKCLHFPYASVYHCWGKGNYRSFYLTLVNIVSAYQYFMKWGWKLW